MAADDLLKFKAAETENGLEWKAGTLPLLRASFDTKRSFTLIVD